MTFDRQPRTFISYSRVNKEFALKLASELRSSGFSVWLDQLDIPTGARWDDEVERALDECEIFMVILTPASSNSDNVRDEISYAIDARKRILPVLLENATIPLRLRRFQYVDFTGKSYKEGVELSKRILSSLVEQKPEQGNRLEVSQLDEHHTENISHKSRDLNIENQESGRFPSVPEQMQEPKNTFLRRKLKTESFVVGVIVLVLFTIPVVAFIFSAGVNVRELIPDFILNPETTVTPTPKPQPVFLESSDARDVIANNAGKGILTTAREQYTEEEIKNFQENSQPIPVLLSEPGPIYIGYVNLLCATTRNVLFENLAYMKVLVKLDNKVALDANFVDDYHSNFGMECVDRRLVIDGWTPGSYFIYQEITLTQTISDGQEDIEPFTESQAYIVTVP
jgi:hypothetical protein